MESTDLTRLEQRLLLAVWRLGHEAYGVSIRDTVRERTGEELSVGAIYTTLVRLEKRGLVRSRLSEPTPERGGKAKRYFRITAHGARELAAARAELERLWEGADSFPAPAEGEA